MYWVVSMGTKKSGMIPPPPYTDYPRNLVDKGVVIKATTGYIEKHRKELQNTYKKFEAFNEKFEIDDKMCIRDRQWGEHTQHHRRPIAAMLLYHFPELYFCHCKKGWVQN